MSDVYNAYNAYNDDARLTKREQEVADLLLRGRSYKEIAVDLFIGVETVRSHIRKLYPKCGVRSRGELAWRMMGRARPA